MAGKGPQFGIKPGQVKIFNAETGAESASKQIGIAHAEKWETHPSTQSGE